MEVKLKGETLEGYFRGEMKYDKEGLKKYLDCSEIKVVFYWYECSGRIKKNEEYHFFMLSTPHREFSGYRPENNLTFEESLIYLGGRSFPYEGDYQGRISKRLIPEKLPQLIDLVLTDYISQDSESEIPLVIPKELKLDELIEKGLCYEDNGQVRMGFG